jgi:cytochrome c5
MPALRVTARDLNVAALLEENAGWPVGLVRFGRSRELDTGGRGGALMGVSIWQYFRGARILRIGFLLRTAMLAQSVQAQFAADSGREVFAENCARCHGVRLMATGAAPDLKLLRADQRGRFDEIVPDGKGQMPAWVGMVTDEQIDDDKMAVDHHPLWSSNAFHVCRGQRRSFMPLHATAHHAMLDDRELSTTAAPSGASGWLRHVVTRFLPPRNSAAAVRPGLAEARWYEPPGAVRGS